MTGPERFGRLPDGQDVTRSRIAAGDLEAQVLTFGATVQDLHYRGRRMVIGADTIDAYLNDLRYSGAVVGRFANRIGKARFDLDGQTYRTDPNFLGRHTLHGGARGTGECLWTLEEARADSIRLSLTLPDGHMGFPGALSVSVTYSIAPPAALRVKIEARSTRATPCSFAHHGYFVLDDTGTVTHHDLQIEAAHYLPVDDDLIPLGGPAPVSGTAFDFRKARPVGKAGYDHNFCLSDAAAPMRPVARLTSAASGVTMQISTTEPGLQVYDGAHLGGLDGHGRQRLRPNPGIALETQAWPDSPNRADFPNCILTPDNVYRTETHYIFADL